MRAHLHWPGSDGSILESGHRLTHLPCSSSPGLHPRPDLSPLQEEPLSLALQHEWDYYLEQSQGREMDEGLRLLPE